MKHFAFLLMVLVVASSSAQAQDSIVVVIDTAVYTSPVGITAEYGLASNSVAFTRLPGVESCCTDFVGAQGMSAGIGASLRLAQVSPSVSLRASAGGVVMTSPMSTTSREIVDYQGNAYDASIRHDLTTRLWLAQLSLEGVIAVAPWLHLSIGVGGTLPVGLSYDISETIVSPDKLVFETGGVSRNQQRGTSSSGQAALFVPVSAAGPAIRVGQELSIQPFVSMQHMLTTINATADWGATTFRAGIRLALQREDIRYDTLVIKKPVPPVQDTTVVEPEVIAQRIIVQGGIRDSASDRPISEITFTYNVNRRRLAVLPAVFFDSAQATIPERFLSRQILEDTIPQDAISDLDVNHSMLHILGTTMQRNKRAALTITGSHAEDGEPNQRMQLARQRASSVVQHLVSVYNIDSSRIRIRVRDLPERPSSQRTDFGRAENRRVDLELSNATYDLPIQPDTLITSSPLIVQMAVEARRSVTVEQVRLSLIADGNVIASKDTALTTNPVVSRIPISPEMRTRLFRADSAELVIHVRDSLDGQIAERMPAMRVRALPDEVQPFDEFGIVLFDYNSSRIAESENDVIRDLRQRVARADHITVTGTADESGSELENLRLAENRAQSVVRALGLLPGTYDLQRRIATDYSSDLPEGRMLSRQVKIVLQTGTK